MADRRFQLDTYFAPAPREPIDVVETQAALVCADPLVTAALDPANGATLLLNRKRQILAANRPALEALGASDLSAVLGKRPGEAFGCLQVREGPSGCGTASGCQMCGAVIAVLGAHRSRRETEAQCTIDLAPPRAPAELDVKARPLRVAGLDLVALSLRRR